MMRFIHSHGLTRTSVILLVVALGACSKPPAQQATGGPTGTPQAVPPTAGSGSPVASTRPASTVTNGGAPGPSRRYTFAPDAPLPAPADVSSGPEEERALLLARQVLAGGEGARAALVAALQQAGFPIRDAAGTILVQPVGKSQGITFELWEVNALAESIANRERMYVPLDNFAEMIAAPMPELRDAPMTDFVLDGVRTRALDTDGSLLFWAVFIAELGRQDKVREPYEILLDIDPAKTQPTAVPSQPPSVPTAISAPASPVPMAGPRYSPTFIDAVAEPCSAINTTHHRHITFFGDLSGSVSR